jgi:hypothetical protein
MLRIALAQALHHRLDASLARRRNQEMHVVRHQTVGVHSAAKSFRQLAQVKEIQDAVVVRLEANAAVGATLDHVRSHIGEEQAKLPGHGKATPLEAPRLTNRGLTRIPAYGDRGLTPILLWILIPSG